MKRYRGSIVKIKDGYRVFAPMVDGKRKSKVVHGSRKEAERVLEEISLEKSDTFGNACKRYLAHVEAREKAGELSASTVKEYRRIIETRLAELYEVPVSWLTVERLRFLLDSLPRNKRAVHKTLRQVFNWLEKSGEITYNPVKRLEAPSKPQLVGKEGIYTPEEVQAILAGLNSEPEYFRLAVLLALGCGLRRGEICGLEWSDYDGERVRVNKAFEKDKPKTLSSVRVVSVPSFVRDHFPKNRKGRIVKTKPDSITQRWRLYVRRNGIRELPFKNLRHTSLTMVYEATGDIYATSRRAGHASISITTRYYARPSQTVDDLAGEALDRLITENAPQQRGIPE